MVQKLIKLRAKVDIQDNEGWTPLHAAASCGHDHIVRLEFLSLSLSFSLSLSLYFSLLHSFSHSITYTIFNNYFFVHRYLLDHGAFPAPVNNEGDTPFDLAEDYDNIQDIISEQVKAQGVDVDAIRTMEESVMLEDANK